MKRRAASEIGPPPWSLRDRMRYCWLIAKLVFIKGDTNTIRCIMAAASFLFAVGLLLPLHTFLRPSFAGMAALLPKWAWAIMFLLHTAGVAWRLVDLVPRSGWAFAINAWGIGIWSLYLALATMAVGEYSPTTAMEIVVLMAAFVAMIRTGFNDERISP